MDEAREKLRLNCRWSLHPWRRLEYFECLKRIIHANLVIFFYKSRDFSERVYSNTALLSYLTLSSFVQFAIGSLHCQQHCRR